MYGYKYPSPHQNVADREHWTQKLTLAFYFLSRFCGAVGAGTVCDDVHAALDIKHLMLDTLGWVLPRILAATSQVIHLMRY